MHRVNVRAIERFLEKNPNASYSDFKAENKVKVSDRYFYLIRERIRKTRVSTPSEPVSEPTARKSRSKVYLRVFTAPTEGMTDKTKETLHALIAAINNTHGTKMEMVEYLSPAQIEVREART